MKISELHVTGFRSLKDVVWKPGDLNVVIGPNGSGKSNLLQVLEMLSESAKGSLSSYVQASGGSIPLLWDGQTRQILATVKYAITERPSSFGGAVYRIIFTQHMAAELRVSAEELELYKDDEALELQLFATLIERGPQSIRIFDDKFEPLDVPRDKVPVIETLLSSAGGPFAKNGWMSQMKAAVEGLTIYQALDVRKQAKVRQPTITQFAEQVDGDMENFSAALHTLYTRNSEFEEAINDGMKAAFADYERLKFPPAAEQRIQLELKWQSSKNARSSASLSDGTLKFLGLLTILANPTPPPLVAIDEPETGLHPRMFPIIAEFAAAASRRTQVVFTTHSPQFLDAFRDQTPTVTVTKWEDGQTKLKVLDGDELKYWLKEYTLGSLFESGELEALA